MPKRPEPRLVGVAEFVDFPDWGVRNVRARVDTGAQTSALHVENVRPVGASRVRFEVRLEKADPRARVTVEAKVTRRTPVRASTGHSEPRLFVGAYILLGGREQWIEVGLVDRSKMLYRMLIGRAALEGRYLVDVTKRYALGKSARATLRKESRR